MNIAKIVTMIKQKVNKLIIFVSYYGSDIKRCLF